MKSRTPAPQADLVGSEKPIAWRWRDNEHQAWNFIDADPVHMDYVIVEPLYANPPQAVQARSEGSDEPISTEQLLARVASIICDETCGLTSLCKSHKAAKSLFYKGYLARSDAPPEVLNTAIYRLCCIEDSPNLNEGEKSLIRKWIADLRSPSPARSSAPPSRELSLLRRMSDGMDHMSPEDTIGYTNGSFWIDVATVEEIRNAAYPTPAPQPNVLVTESSWQWWAGSNEEWCTVGPEDSRDAIIQAATHDSLGECDDDGGWKLVFHIVEARQDDLRLSDWIESDRLLERAEESIADSDRTSSECDDGPWFECSAEQEKDLEERVKAACDQWQAAHGLKFSCSTFSATRNKEVVVVDTAIEALAATEGSAE